MLEGLNILVVEDEFIVALDIADAVEQAGGRVIGPVSSVAQALVLLEAERIDAAILDANLIDRNITPVVHVLRARGTPLVVQTGAGLSEELAALLPAIKVIRKPARTDALIKAISES